jgi:hypothetical protein
VGISDDAHLKRPASLRQANFGVGCQDFYKILVVQGWEKILVLVFFCPGFHS